MVMIYINEKDLLNAAMIKICERFKFKKQGTEAMKYVQSSK